MTDADVLVVGAGPTGLMLAIELRLVGVRPLVLERQAGIGETARANGFNGQILQLLRYRGLLERIEAASNGPLHTAPRVPFGGMDLDTSHLTDAPLQALSLPQHRLERVLGERAAELGAEIRRGHAMVGITQDETAVSAEVRGPDGPYRTTARYLVGCDGAHSTVRDLSGIAFPGVTYPEVNRLGQFAVHDSVTRTEDGDLEVPGLGRLRAGFTRTPGGVFASGTLRSGLLMIQTTEDDDGESDDATPMTLTELQASIRRVLGAELPLGKATRLSRYRVQARLAERYVDRRTLLAGDAAHQFPATGIGINVGMLDAVNLAWKLAACIHGWAPSGLLRTYHDERHFAGTRAMLHAQAQVALRRGQDGAADALRELFQELLLDEPALRRIAALIAGTELRYSLPGANHPLTGGFAGDFTLSTGRGTTSVAELMHAARPILLDLADRRDIREVADPWRDRVDVHTAAADARQVDAVLIRPDGIVAWAAGIDESTHVADATLRHALATWFGSA